MSAVSTALWMSWAQYLSQRVLEVWVVLAVHSPEAASGDLLRRRRQQRIVSVAALVDAQEVDWP